MKKTKIRPFILKTRIKLASKFDRAWGYLKSAKGALLLTYLIIFCIISTIISSSILKIKVPESLIALASITSAIATVVICLYTAKSVAEVIKANKENQKINHQRDAKDSFEKKFSLLLQEHNNYLNKIINSSNALYDVSYIQKASGYESYDIIRGAARFISLNNFKFCFHDGLMLVRIDAYTDEEKQLYYYFPTANFIEKNNLKILAKVYEVYSSGENVYFYYPITKRIIASEQIPSALANKNVIFIIEKALSDHGEEAKKKLLKNNSISKNILSPYMRVIYHILKCSSENTESEEEMKKHTNIVRSIIPHDILMLVAINAMYFYKSFSESRNELNRWSDLFHESENDAYKQVFNDYHKYYKLLLKCDFFEHLNMDFTLVKEKLKNLKIDIDLSLMRPQKFDSEKMVYSAVRSKMFLLIDGDTESTCMKLYKTFHHEMMQIETEILILLFYFSDLNIESFKSNIMDEVIYLNGSEKFTWKMKSSHYHYNLSFANESYIFKTDNKVIVSRDFLYKYTRGELPFIIKTNL